MRATHVMVVCHDGPDAGPARKAATPAHLRYVESILERLAVAGPLYSEDGAQIVGSLYVFGTDDLEQARAWLQHDPYFAAGIWQSIEYRPFLPAAGTYLGGTIW